MVLPPIVVVDFSWALINAVVQTFNNCSVIAYLTWAYDVIYKYHNNEQLNNYMLTRVILCQTHIFKDIAIKSNLLIKRKISYEKNYAFGNQLKKIFLFCFTVLQNCVSFEEFDNVLYEIFNIFSKENMDSSVINSIDNINKLIKDRNLDIYNMHEFNLIKKFENDKSNIKIYIKNEVNGSIITSSPFTAYFNDLIKKFQSSKEKDFNDKQCEKNIYYDPDLFKLISDKLYIMPFWSGLMIKQCQTQMLKNDLVNKSSEFFNITRITNNPVENHIGFVKNRILMRRKNMVTSEMVSPIYNEIKSIYLEFFEKNQNLKVPNNAKD